jgi:hypothetical protein
MAELTDIEHMVVPEAEYEAAVQALDWMNAAQHLSAFKVAAPRAV